MRNLRYETGLNSATVARGKARSAIFQAIRLSTGARLIYLFLDDMDWNSQGMAWPKQTTIAVKLGLSRREVQRCIAELTEAGKITVERKKAHCIYYLEWNSIATARAHPKNEQATARAHHEATARAHPSIYETIEAEPTCEMANSTENCARCGGEGWYLHRAAKRVGQGSQRVVVCGCREITLDEAIELSARKRSA